MRPAKLIAVAVVNDRDRFLVGLRPEGVPLAGFSEFPGGKVEPGEDAGAAAVRECLEETGIPVAIHGEYESVEFDYEHARVAIRFFACRPLSLTARPLAPFRWVERETLATLRFPPANEALLARLARVTWE